MAGGGGEGKGKPGLAQLWFLNETVMILQRSLQYIISDQTCDLLVLLFAVRT